MARKVGWKIGKLFSKCFNVIIPENGNKNGVLMKMLVEVKLQNPLLRGTKLKFDDEFVWIEFRYEKLLTFCFIIELLAIQKRTVKKRYMTPRIHM